MTRNTNNSAQSAFSSAFNTPSVPMHRSFNINISHFDGDPEHLEFFITQVTDVSACNNYSDKETLAYAIANLRGPAKTFFIQKSEYHPIPTSQELFSVLRAQFRRQNPCRAISEFHNLSMRSGESVRNLAHRLDSLAPRAHENIKDKAALDAIKFNKFISIIPNNYRIHILQNNIKTYTEAMEKAILLQDCEVNNEFICQTSSSSTPLQEIRSELNAIKETVSHFENSSHQSKNFHRRNKFRTHNNQKPYSQNNHRQSSYKNNNSKKFRKPSYNTSQVSEHQQGRAFDRNKRDFPPSMQNVICQFCGAFGHVCRFCPNFKNFFQPKQSPAFINYAMTTPMNLPITSASVECPGTSATPTDQFNYNDHYSQSNLNPEAPSFTFPPNW